MQQQNGNSGAAAAAFWRFSLALYARPGVAEALIALQDRAGRNVNLILLALWLGTRGKALDSAILAGAAAAIAPLEAGIILPLRRLRRQLKGARDGDIEALRRRVAGLEIAAERAAQRRLVAILGSEAAGPSQADPLAAAMANLARYLGEAAGAAEAGVLSRALAGLMRHG
ncbi:MAG TPA: TIGR02444 family protein [Stellaceae bacterium]|nr:TIGR02444 family protein [Stellaceae bacterium]